MRKYIQTIEKCGIGLLVATFIISTLWGSANAFFPMLLAVVLLVIDVAYKALHWNEYLKENKRNMYILLALVVLVLMNTFIGL